MATSSSTISKKNPGKSTVARNIHRERINAIYDNVGMITMFSGPSTSVPPGWLLCDGSEVLKTAFPELWTLIGTTYGTGATGYFVLPDFDNALPIGPLASTGIVTAIGGTATADRVVVSADHSYLGVFFIIRAY